MSMVLGVIAAAVASVAARGVVAHRRHAREDLAWNEVASALGLRFVATGEGRVGGLLAGASGGFRVRVERRGPAGGGAACVVSVSGGGIPSDLQVERRAGWSWASSPIEVGDAELDAELAVRGHSARALLDAATRRGLRASLADGMTAVTHGAVTVTVPDRDLVDRHALVTAAEAALRIAQHLTLAEGEAPERLAAIAAGDVNRAVRLGALRALLEEHRHHPATLRALTAALARGNAPAMRLLAAQQVGDGGEAALLELARCPDAQVAVAASEALVARGGRYDEEAMRDHLRASDLEVAAQAAASLGAHGTVASVEALLAAAESAPRLGGAELRRAARQAAAEIQGRLQGAEAGRLSLAGEHTGALSVARPEGALSMADPSHDG